MAAMNTFLYRMTHIDNIPHIIVNGITHATSTTCNESYVAIGDRSLISSRNEYLLSNGKEIGVYIPFYFFYRMPMLYVIQKGYNGVSKTAPEDIVYCLVKVDEVVAKNLEFVFTDGHAKNRLSTVYFKKDIDKIDQILDWTAIKSTSWVNENDTDLKRRKEAEFLIEGDIPADSICGYVVHNEDARQKLIALGIDESKVVVRPSFYF